MACCLVQKRVFDGSVNPLLLEKGAPKVNCALILWKPYKQNYNMIQTGMSFRPSQAISRTKWTEMLTVGLYIIYCESNLNSLPDTDTLVIISFVSLRTWQMAIMEEAQAILQFSLHSRETWVHTYVFIWQSFTNPIPQGMFPSKKMLNQAEYLRISTEHTSRNPNDIKQI